MSEQQKKVVAICVLGALVVGAGGWYFLMRDTGTEIDYSQQGTTQRRVRSTDDSGETKVTRRQRKSADTTATQAKRKVRDRGVRKSGKRRSRRSRSGPARVDKLQDAPRM